MSWLCLLDVHLCCWKGVPHACSSPDCQRSSSLFLPPLCRVPWQIYCHRVLAHTRVSQMAPVSNTNMQDTQALSEERIKWGAQTISVRCALGTRVLHQCMFLESRPLVRSSPVSGRQGSFLLTAHPDHFPLKPLSILCKTLFPRGHPTTQ